jgi:hypothetical protein
MSALLQEASDGGHGGAEEKKLLIVIEYDGWYVPPDLADRTWATRTAMQALRYFAST